MPCGACLDAERGGFVVVSRVSPPPVACCNRWLRNLSGISESAMPPMSYFKPPQAGAGQRAAANATRGGPHRARVVRLPLVTALVVLCCTIVFFAVQGKDAQREQNAYDFYNQSGLGAIELPRYQAFLAARNDNVSAERLHHLQAFGTGLARAGTPAVRLMQGDGHFLASLHDQHVVRDDDPDFAHWQADRARFEEMLDQSAAVRYALARASAGDVWRYLSYAFVHGGAALLLGNMLVLLLLGPLVEANLGALRFAGAYLAGAVLAGALHVLLSEASLMGASGAVAATVGMFAVACGSRPIPLPYWPAGAAVSRTFGGAAGGAAPRIPGFALLPVWLASEGYQWAQASTPGAALDVFAVHAGALCAGALLAWMLQRPALPGAARDARAADQGPRHTEHGSRLLEQARDAAARLDIRRATRLYQELIELEPKNTEYLGAYLNVTMLGADDEALQDAALRILWAKYGTPTEELRRVFLQLTQPKVLKSLPIDEHLRLARRLVRFREDAAALRVIDALLRDDHLRQLYGRQLADCLLGLFTAYTRSGLHRPAEQINSRLSTYF